MRRALYAAMRGFGALDRWLRERLTRAGWLALGSALTAGAAGIDQNRTVTAQVFTVLAALLLLAWLASLSFRTRFEARRELPRYATAGERYLYRVTLRSHDAKALAGATLTEDYADPRPCYEEWRAAREPGEARRNWFDRNVGYFRWRWLIERRLPETEPELTLPELMPRDAQVVTLGFTPRRRGRIELAGLRMARSDPLGLVRGLSRIALPGHVTALPRRYRLPALAMPGRRKFQQGGVSLSASIGDSEEFLGLRDYRPGDPLQHIHWKSFARTGRPIVKEFQDEFFERHALVLDTGSERGEDAAFEDAIALAASFVCTIDTQECLLDLLFLSGPRAAPPAVRSYTAGRGQMHAEHMLEVLAGVAPSPPQAFAAIGGAVRARLASLASVIVVLLGWDEARRRFVAGLRAQGIEVRALLVCPRDEAPQDGAPGALMLHPGTIEHDLVRLR